MDKEQTTFGLSPEKLTRLLSIGSEINRSEEEADQDEEKADLLQDRLEETLPLERFMLKFLPASLLRLCDKLGVLAGEPIGKLLQNPKSDISLIKKVKDYSKNLSECAKTEAESDTAIAIYYAAIAHALIFHNQKITRFSIESLNSALCSLIQKPWVSNELIELYKKAGEISNSQL